MPAGTIPDWGSNGGMAQMAYLWLYNTQFTGVLPQSLSTYAHHEYAALAAAQLLTLRVLCSLSHLKVSILGCWQLSPC